MLQIQSIFVKLYQESISENVHAHYFDVGQIRLILVVFLDYCRSFEF